MEKTVEKSGDMRIVYEDEFASASIHLNCLLRQMSLVGEQVMTKKVNPDPYDWLNMQMIAAHARKAFTAMEEHGELVDKTCTVGVIMDYRVTNDTDLETAGNIVLNLQAQIDEMTKSMRDGGQVAGFYAQTICAFNAMKGVVVRAMARHLRDCGAGKFISSSEYLLSKRMGQSGPEWCFYGAHCDEPICVVHLGWGEEGKVPPEETSAGVGMASCASADGLDKEHTPFAKGEHPSQEGTKKAAECIAHFAEELRRAFEENLRDAEACGALGGADEEKMDSRFRGNDNFIPFQAKTAEKVLSEKTPVETPEKGGTVG